MVVLYHSLSGSHQSRDQYTGQYRGALLSLQIVHGEKHLQETDRREAGGVPGRGGSMLQVTF